MWAPTPPGHRASPHPLPVTDPTDLVLRLRYLVPGVAGLHVLALPSPEDCTPLATWATAVVVMDTLRDVEDAVTSFDLPDAGVRFLSL